MKQQKGFSSLIIIFVIVLTMLGFYLGMKSDRYIVSNLLHGINPQQLPEQPISTSSAISNPKQNKAYMAFVDKDTVNFSGEYAIGDFDKVKWTLFLPKNGGEITGTASGACNGKIIGYFETPDTNGEGKISGNLDGECQPVPRFVFKTKVKSTFEGMAHLKTGKIEVIHNTTEPFEWRGSFDLYFTP